MAVKFSNAQIAAIRAAGSEKGPNLVLPLAWLDEVTPDRVRTTSTDRLALFDGVVSQVTPDEAGVRVVNAIALVNAGLPSGSVVNPSYWSGIAAGSVMAYELGYKSRHDVQISAGGCTISIELTPLTEDDKASMAKKLADKASKGATAAPAGDEGAPVENGAGEAASA